MCVCVVQLSSFSRCVILLLSPWHCSSSSVSASSVQVSAGCSGDKVAIGVPVPNRRHTRMISLVTLHKGTRDRRRLVGRESKKRRFGLALFLQANVYVSSQARWTMRSSLFSSAPPTTRRIGRLGPVPRPRPSRFSRESATIAKRPLLRDE